MGFSKGTLADLSFAEIARAINETYEGYAIAIEATAQSVERSFRVTDVARAISPVWSIDGRIAALAAIAMRGRRAWIAALGIAPPFRGHGLARHLVAQALAAAQDSGAGEVRLEVIDSNLPAVRTYRAEGFEPSGVLGVYESAQATGPEGDTGLVAEADADSLLEEADDPSTPWQRSRETLVKHERLRAVITAAPARAWLVFHTEPSPQVLSMHGEYHALLACLRYLRREFHGSIEAYNFPPQSPAGQALQSAGFEERLRQIAMVRTL